MRIYKNAIAKLLLPVADSLQLFLLLMDKIFLFPVLYLIHIVIDIGSKHIQNRTACNISFSVVAELFQLAIYLIKL